MIIGEGIAKSFRMRRSVTNAEILSLETEIN